MEGFIIHQRKFKETSLFLELFTRCKGRFSALAKGANRTKSILGMDLQPSRLLKFEVHEKTSIPLLKSAELIKDYHVPLGLRMFSIFYINELIYKGLQKQDSAPIIFDSYMLALQQISKLESCLETVLRNFEYSFLCSSGVIANLNVTNTGEEVLATDKYEVIPDSGVFKYSGNSGFPLHGSTLLQLSKGESLDEIGLRESKYMMRRLIEHFLGGQELATRNLFKPKG
ncbi:MAG: DNA repair protein RecO [Pseudomonadota bacterium]|nr:DNA repair protein RecO [Pseudomonadota bacterium]